jgi:hypothetical protein
LRKPQACLLINSILLWNPSVIPLLRVKRHMATETMRASQYRHPATSAVILTARTGRPQRGG